MSSYALGYRHAETKTAQRALEVIGWSRHGFDGLLYVLDNPEVWIYDPQTMVFVGMVVLENGNTMRAVAATATGTIYAAGFDGRIYQYDSQGNRINYITTPASNLGDIDIDISGNVVAGSRYGQVVVSNLALDTLMSFQAGDSNVFVTFTPNPSLSIP